MQFKTEVNELLQLMIHSLYSNKEIFLRELISNASDALDKRSLLRAAGKDASSEALEIKITADEAAKCLIIEDSGCGMSAAELEQNLGTIAHSGTKAFMQARAAGGDSAELIGQFGVGFYSAFMVAARVQVFSRAVGDEAAHCWSSDASGYEIAPCEKEATGTKILLHLKDAEFASNARIEYLVNKYSKHINYPIKLLKVAEPKQNAENSAENGAEKSQEFVQINKQTALWKEPKASLKPEDYEQFYADTHYGAKPLAWLHTASEGALDFAALLYVPETAPHDLMQVDYEKQCKLYVRRVFISDKEDLLPVWLRFISGVIDVADLELNVSREILQDSAKLRKISDICAKKMLSAIAKFSGEKKEKFCEQFGAVLKEGLLDPAAAHEEIYKALLFETSVGKISLDELVEKYGNDEKKIYFLQGENLALLQANALAKRFDCVVYLHDRVDEFLAGSLPEFKGFKWQDAREASCDASEANEEQKALADAAAAELGGLIKGVKFAPLADALSAIVYDENDQTYQMAKMMKRFSPQQSMPLVGELVINSENPLARAAQAADATAQKAFAKLAFASAAISSQMSVENLKMLSDAAEYFAKCALEK